MGTLRTEHNLLAILDTAGDLIAAETVRGSGESGAPWRGINPTDIGRHWAPPRTGNFARWIEDNRIPGYTQIRGVHARLDALDAAGLIRWSSTGRPSLIRPAESAVGVKVNSLWTDTAGCAYVPVAAERLGRRWVACDFNPRAWTVFKRQFNKPQLALLCCNDDTTGQQVMASEPAVTIHGPDELPVRTSPERIVTLEPFTPPPRRFKKRALMTDEEMLNELLSLSNYQAWCCGFANRREDGAIIRQDWNFHLDHIDPKAAGGINEIINRAPMCPHHNIRKSNQLVALREYRNQIADAGEMMVSSAGDLIDLGWAQSQVLEIHARYFIQRRPQQTQAMQES